MSYVVAGVSGNTGKVVAETLLSQKKPVRVVVRDAAKGEAWRAKGAEVAVADLGDAGALAKAFAGATGAYVLVPPNMAAADFGAYQDATTSALASAIESAKVPHVVLLSSIGAQHPSGNGPIAGLYRAEKRFSTIASTRFSFLRAGYFIENFAGSLGMLGQGVVPSFFPADFGLDTIATHDIGKVGAQLLVEGTERTQVVELGGPKRTMNDVAAALSNIVGKPIAVQVFPLEAMTATLTSMGLPPAFAAMYHEMTGGILSGHVTYEGGHRRLEGTTTIEEVLRPIVTAAK